MISRPSLGQCSIYSPPNRCAAPAHIQPLHVIAWAPAIVRGKYTVPRQTLFLHTEEWVRDVEEYLAAKANGSESSH